MKNPRKKRWRRRRRRRDLVIWRNHIGDVSDHEGFARLEIQNMGWAYSRVWACKHHKLHFYSLLIYIHNNHFPKIKIKTVGYYLKLLGPLISISCLWSRLYITLSTFGLWPLASWSYKSGFVLKACHINHLTPTWIILLINLKQICHPKQHNSKFVYFKKNKPQWLE